MIKETIASTGLRKKSIKIANALTTSAQSLSLSEKRILFAGIAKAGGMSSTVKLSAQEYALTYGIPVKQAYEQIRNAAKNIFNRYITLTRFDGNENETRHFRWLDEYSYQDGLGTVILSFSSPVIPYLLDIEEQFTKYKLSQACALRSVYSWRLLELFEQQSNGWLRISLENFHHAMNAKKTHRNNFKDTRLKILEPAIKELQRNDSWIINWEAIKNGRKVVALYFVFSRKLPEKSTVVIDEAKNFQRISPASCIKSTEPKSTKVSINALEQGKKIARDEKTGWDIYALEDQFYKFKEKKGPVNDLDKAFLGFIRKKVAKSP